MAVRKEFELWETRQQYLIGQYKTQSSALQALYDCRRYGCSPDVLDLVYQRPNDKQIHLCSAREDRMQEWFAYIDELTVRLRLCADTDIFNNHEWLDFNGYEVLVEDRGKTNTIINMERYAAVLDNAEGIGGGVGATEFEAIANAIIDLKGGVRHD